MGSYSEQLKKRTQRFAVKIIELYRNLPRTEEARGHRPSVVEVCNIGCGKLQSVRRSRSMAEFISKMGIVVEEADETAFWIELLGDASILDKERLNECASESNELLAIFAASYNTARGRRTT